MNATKKSGDGWHVVPPDTAAFFLLRASGRTPPRYTQLQISVHPKEGARIEFQGENAPETINALCRYVYLLGKEHFFTVKNGKRAQKGSSV